MTAQVERVAQWSRGTVGGGVLALGDDVEVSSLDPEEGLQSLAELALEHGGGGDLGEPPGQAPPLVAQADQEIDRGPRFRTVVEEGELDRQGIPGAADGQVDPFGHPLEELTPAVGQEGVVARADRWE